MGSLAGISPGVHQPGQAVGLIADILLICHSTLRQKGHGMAGEEFKLRAGGIAAVDRGKGKSLHRIFFQGINERRHRDVGGKLSKDTQVRKGLIHDHNDIRSVLGFISGGTVPIRQLLQLLFRVALRRPKKSLLQCTCSNPRKSRGQGGEQQER